MIKKEKEQKFFTLIFMQDGKEVTTKVPARKTKTLKETVEEIFDCNNLSIQCNSLFLDASNTPLPFNSEAFLYGGNTLYVKENIKMQVDKRIISFMRNDTISNSKKPATGLVEVNKRFLEVLNSFNDQQVETIKDCVDGGKPDEYGDYELDISWNDLIMEEEDLSMRQKVQQQAIWELFTTEVGFIKDMKVVIDIFQKCFRFLQVSGFLADVEEGLIFANIEEVYNANVTFWSGLKKVIDQTKTNKQTISPCQFVEAFENFEELFQPYIEFCNADTSNLHLPDYSSTTNEMIKQYIAWCDNHEQCKRITMAGFLIKPLQRVTKYSLLLKAISNKSDDEKEKSITEEIRNRVETFVSKINSAIHLRQEQEKLDNVINRVLDYSPIEPISDEVEKIIKEYCDLNFKGNIPGLSAENKRFILKEGPMKLIEKNSKKDVYAFLFTDVFIVTKFKRSIDKYRINRQPYRLNKLIVRTLKDTGQLLFIYLNEYGVAANAFICQVDLEEQEKWKNEIDKAKKEYEIIRVEFGLRDTFWDDELPSSPVSPRPLKRTPHIRILKKMSTIQSPPSPEPTKAVPQLNHVTYEWDMVLTFVTIGVFVILNMVMSRVNEYLDLHQ